MTRFKLWLLHKIASSICVQGPNHKANIIHYYKVLNEVARTEFCEDNKITLDAFLTDCHLESLKVSHTIMGPWKFGVHK